METTKLTKEILEQFVAKAYDTAKKQGFYPADTTVTHHLMMIITEMGEAIQVDRKDKHGSIADYESWLGVSEQKAYEESLEGTVESELADVAIRILSLIGYLLQNQPNRQEAIFCTETIYESADYYKLMIRKSSETLPLFLFRMVHKITYSALDVSPVWRLVDKLQHILCHLYAYAQCNDIDLVEHIRLKMEYNECRGYKHGYLY